MLFMPPAAAGRQKRCASGVPRQDGITREGPLSRRRRHAATAQVPRTPPVVIRSRPQQSTVPARRTP